MQESAPERLELKQALLAEACAAAAPGRADRVVHLGAAPDGAGRRGWRGPSGSWSRIRSTRSTCCRSWSCAAGERTEPETIERARELYGSLGMAPLVVRKEIDGFVADRMLEALWREALWLVNDGIATVAEVDDAIRLGAGLRWAFMGTFLTYRIAGGEAGMRHFMAQFGPALQWPWTKLMDVPELTDELLDTIVAQSDEQAEGRSVRELEQLRDDCLVSVLQALRARDIGAGAVLARHERELAGVARRRACSPTATISRSRSRCTRATVAPDWVDYNGHAHESRYLQVFGDASDALFALPRHRRRSTCAGGQLLHGREPPLAPARGAARRSPRGHDAGARLRRAPAARLPLALARGRRRAARDGRAAVPARRHGRPPRRARRRRGARARRSGSPRRTPRCRAPSAPAARSPSRAAERGSDAAPALTRAMQLAAVAASLRARFDVAVGARRDDHHVDVARRSRCASSAPSCRA